MRDDADALTTFARSGIKMFWFRQVMFIGATAITTVYLTSIVPVLCYLTCLGAELGEVYFSRRALAIQEFTQKKIDQLLTMHAIVAAWSAISVSVYGVLVASLGEEQFLFVPLIYMFAAALYAAMFNHQVKRLLIIRMVIYVAGFLILALSALVAAEPEERFLGFIQFFTVVSASFFVVINAIEFRKGYCERRGVEAEAALRETKILSEIKERQDAEAARANSEKRFMTLFENAPIPIREEDLSGMKRLIDGLGIRDRNEFSLYLDDHPEFLEACGRTIVVVDANRASLNQHGYADKSEMLSRVVRSLSPAAMRIVRMTVEAIYDGASGRDYETRITRTDGQVRTVAATWSVLPGYEDSYARILLCSVDLTDRLASEAALRQAQKMEAVGQLTGGVAHDFNNLLTVISGNVDLMEATVGVDRQLSEPIQKAVRRGAELTQRLLAFSRKQPLVASPIRLGTLIVGMSDLLRRSLGEEIQVEIDVPEDLWTAYADSAQVEAALLNLALNSRDAMPGGGTLGISCRNMHVQEDNELEVEAGEYVRLSVTDSGCGMSPEVASRAYEPFFTTKEVGKGSGLGLSMVYGFARQSNGALQIESKRSKGTTVSVLLPRSNHGEPDAPAKRTSAVTVDGQGETILILEDDPDVRDYLAKLMESFGYNAIQARDAMAAREALGNTERIDLLVSDIMLPGGIRGPEFAAEMRAYFPGTPVVFISGRPAEMEAAESYGLKNSNVLSKPFSREQLAERILEALGK